MCFLECGISAYIEIGHEMMFNEKIKSNAGLSDYRIGKDMKALNFYPISEYSTSHIHGDHQ